MANAVSIEAALRHDRAIVLAALGGITAVAWMYMFREARAMDATGVCRCAGMAMSGTDVKPWSGAAILPLFLMWAEMMVAMMLPSAAPMILTFATVNRRRRELERPFTPTGLFVSGYLIVWSVFSLLAALAQWGLHGAALLSPAMKSSSAMFGGTLLIAAGAFQWTPWKRACLNHCRSPLQFIMTDWREGPRGALTMGLRHGAYCTGCCWMLMALLFVAGVMNMVWVATIAILVLLEKVAPTWWRLRHATGVILVAWGVWVISAGSWQ
jgi:predicted metal-binding membrane protein